MDLSICRSNIKATGGGLPQHSSLEMRQAFPVKTLKHISPLPAVNSARNLIALSAFLLLASSLIAVLNFTKVKALRHDLSSAVWQRQSLERQHSAAEKAMKDREVKVATESAKIEENDKRIAGAEAELVKTQTEKADLQSKLQANEAQIMQLQKRLDELTKTPANPNPGAPSAAELQAQLEDARKQLDSAESEKALLAEKMQPTAESRGLQEAVKRREPAFRGSIRGRVLAVNQAYNFVVLNLGQRNGVEANTEMMVLRGGNLIGKIRISSVEPATAIGDIVGKSLARGVQVQPGDIVIYAGSNS
jgi:predicted RNase H-like nuclease (RuvC/YqgF family)